MFLYNVYHKNNSLTYNVSQILLQFDLNISNKGISLQSFL